MLLGAETNSKASAKSEFLANVSTNDCTSEMGGTQSAETNSSEGTFLPNGAVCCNSFAFVAFFTFGHFSVFLTPIFLTNVFKLVVHVVNLRVFAINGPLPLLVMLLGVVVMHMHIVALLLLLHPALGLVPTLLGVLRVASLREEVVSECDKLNNFNDLSNSAVKVSPVHIQFHKLPSIPSSTP